MKKCHAKKSTTYFWLNNFFSNLAIMYGLYSLDISFLYWPLLCRGYLISIAYCLFFFHLLQKQLKQIVGQTWLILVTLTCRSWSEGQHDLYFTVQEFCHILKTIWCLNIIVWDNESVWHDIWPQNKCRSLWPICHGTVILPYILKTIWCINFIIWDYESVWPEVWPKNKCRSLWPIFHDPVILRYILNIWDYGSVWPHVWPQHKCSSVWPIFHGPVILSYLQDYLMHECHIFGWWDSVTQTLTSK